MPQSAPRSRATRRSLPVTVQQKSRSLRVHAVAAGHAHGRLRGGYAARPPRRSIRWGIRSMARPWRRPGGCRASALSRSMQTGHVQSVGNGTTYVYASQRPTRDSLQVTVAQRARASSSWRRTGSRSRRSAAPSSSPSRPLRSEQQSDRQRGPTLASLDPDDRTGQFADADRHGHRPGRPASSPTQDLTADTVLVQVANLPVKLSLSVDSAIMNSVGDTLKLGVTFTNALGGTVTGLVPRGIPRTRPSCRWPRRTGGWWRFARARRGSLPRTRRSSDTALITVTNAPASIHICQPRRYAAVDRRHAAHQCHDPEYPRRLAAADLRDLVGGRTAVATVSTSGDGDFASDRSHDGPRHERHLGDSAALWVTNVPRHIVLNSTSTR